MVISQTPLRISFVGGGTDLPDYYRNNGGGAVLSTTIDKYIYVIAKRRFDEKIRIGYTRTELVDSVDDVQHDLVREALRKVGVTSCIEITTIADIPSTGSGLGASGSVIVGLLNALYNLKGECVSNPEKLAREACEIEIDILGRPVGKQDQYAAAYGGMNVIKFNPDETVDVEPIRLSDAVKKRIGKSLMLFYTGLRRDSADVLSEQKDNISSTYDTLNEMKLMVEDTKEYLYNGQLEDPHRLGTILHSGWQRKRKLASKITNATIDTLYKSALEAGATGGKISGAGGGGFLLLYCPEGRQDAVRRRLAVEEGYSELPFEFEPHGSRMIFRKEWT